MASDNLYDLSENARAPQPFAIWLWLVIAALAGIAIPFGDHLITGKSLSAVAALIFGILPFLITLMFVAAAVSHRRSSFENPKPKVLTIVMVALVMFGLLMLLPIGVRQVAGFKPTPSPFAPSGKIPKH